MLNSEGGMTELKGCPFCGAKMMECHALWPSEGDTDSIIHADLTDCPLRIFSLGTADECVSVRAAWNHRSPSPDAEAARREAIEEAARNVVAERFSTYKARNGREVGIEDSSGEKCWIVPFDAMAALERAIRSLSSPPVEGEQW